MTDPAIEDTRLTGGLRLAAAGVVFGTVTDARVRRFSGQQILVRVSSQLLRTQQWRYAERARIRR